MKTSELREKSIDELNKTLYETSKELFQLRMKHSTGQLTKTHQLQATQRNVARLRTILTEKQKAGANND